MKSGGEPKKLLFISRSARGISPSAARARAGSVLTFRPSLMKPTLAGIIRMGVADWGPVVADSEPRFDWQPN